MPRLRRSDCSGRGIVRRRRGRGFEYRWADTGRKVDDESALERIRTLAIPPAWQDVWICPWPNGHLQAVGTDAAGRRQYRYHDAWRTRRDAQKFDQMVAFAAGLPALREACSAALAATDELTRERVLASAVRLLDHGFFRIGSEAYAADNDSYGLATLRKDHVTIDGDVMRFDYRGKAGKRLVLTLADPDVLRVVARLLRRRGGGQELLAYRASPRGRWLDVTSADINAYVKELLGDEYSAKLFRTWNATVLAAIGFAVAVDGGASRAARKRVTAHVIREVAHYLGNTPAVARKSYVDPRVIDRYESGWTIAGVLQELGDDVELGAPSIQGVVEQAVIDLLTDQTQSPAIERHAA